LIDEIGFFFLLRIFCKFEDEIIRNLNNNMKNILPVIFILAISLLSFPAYSQTENPAAAAAAAADTTTLGLPGDGLDLYAVLNLFQKSKTIEEFEKSLNLKETGINNLDLNLDGKVDFIKVTTKQKDKDFTFICQVDVTEKEVQDVAVILVSKDKDGKVTMQIVGDPELYGKDYVIEPKTTPTPSVTANPAYTGADPVTVSVPASTTTVVVEQVPIVQYVYSPVYVPYYPPYYYSYYPPYFAAFTVMAVGIYRHNNYYHHGGYYGGHGNTVVVHNHNTYNNYNNNSRHTSNTVNHNNSNGNYNSNRGGASASTRDAGAGSNRGGSSGVSASTRDAGAGSRGGSGASASTMDAGRGGSSGASASNRSAGASSSVVSSSDRAAYGGSSSRSSASSSASRSNYSSSSNRSSGSSRSSYSGGGGSRGGGGGGRRR
jgi:hypothetical protein